MINAMNGTGAGPNGSDKFLVDPASGKMIVTNDGATIVRNLSLNHPAARLLVQAVRAHEQRVGDGTTSFVLLTAELLRQAEALVSGRGATRWVAKGFALASLHAQRLLLELATPLTRLDQVRCRLTIVKLPCTGQTVLPCRPISWPRRSCRPKLQCRAANLLQPHLCVRA